MPRRPDIQYVQFYTGGNLAYKPEISKPVLPQPVRKTVKRKRKNLYIDPLAIGGILVAVVMLVLMLVGVGQLRNAQAQTEQMRMQVSELQKEHEKLQADFDREVDLDEIRWQAEALGLVPVEQVTHITVKAPEYPEEEASDGWERFYIFLAGLFA